MKTFKKSEVRALVQIMAGIKLANMTSEVKVPLTRNFVRLRSVVKEIEDIQKDTSEKLITEDYKLLSEKRDRTSEEETIFTEMSESINTDYAAVIDPILKEECEIDIHFITDKQFDKFVEKFDLELAIAGIIYDNFVKADEPVKEVVAE